MMPMLFAWMVAGVGHDSLELSIFFSVIRALGAFFAFSFSSSSRFILCLYNNKDIGLRNPEKKKTRTF